DSSQAGIDPPPLQQPYGQVRQGKANSGPRQRPGQTSVLRPETGHQAAHGAIEPIRDQWVPPECPQHPHANDPPITKEHEHGVAQKAETAYREALAIQKRLADDFPAVPAYRQGLARSHGNLGILLKSLGKLPEAEAAYRLALATEQKLA